MSLVLETDDAAGAVVVPQASRWGWDAVADVSGFKAGARVSSPVVNAIIEVLQVVPHFKGVERGRCSQRERVSERLTSGLLGKSFGLIACATPHDLADVCGCYQDA